MFLLRLYKATRTGPGLSPADFRDGYTPPADGSAVVIIKLNGAVYLFQYDRFNYQYKTIQKMIII